MGTTVHMDMYLTAGAGIAALFLGVALTRWIPALKRFCIPAPVSGGIVVSLLTLACHGLFGLDFAFDGTLKDFCMLLFFTSVGFQSNLRVVRQGGRQLLVMVGLVAALIVLQNLLSVGIAKGMHLDPLIGMATGSIPMAGGHGTAGGFSPVLERMGLQGAASVTMAAATFGLVAGSLIGGPLGERLVERHRLARESESSDVLVEMEGSDAAEEKKEEHPVSDEQIYRKFTQGACQLLLAMAAGVGINRLLALTGLTFPTYFGALLAAALIRNLSGKKAEKWICTGPIVSIGNTALSLFLGMAMATLKLWELAGLMLPLVVILLAQMGLIILFSLLVAYPALGKTYDAAVLVSGLCGFGLGATPNAMANMSAVCFKYHYSVKPFIIVPVIGAMFVDIINTGVITFFLNIL